MYKVRTFFLCIKEEKIPGSAWGKEKGAKACATTGFAV